MTLVTPTAVGGAALNIRYLQRRKIPAAVAAASVGLSQVVAFVLHLLLLVVFAAITGSQAHSLQPPTWVYFVIAGLIHHRAHGRCHPGRAQAAARPAGAGAGPGGCRGCSR